MTTHWTPINFAAINALCLQRLDNLLRLWLPDERQVNREWVALNLTRADRRPGSFRINMDTGKWADFATRDAGGDVISLYAYLFNLFQTQAARHLAKQVGAAA